VPPRRARLVAWTGGDFRRAAPTARSHDRRHGLKGRRASVPTAFQIQDIEASQHVMTSADGMTSASAEVALLGRALPSRLRNMPRPQRSRNSVKFSHLSVHIEHQGSAQHKWTFAGARRRGQLHRYLVVDKSRSKPSRWLIGIEVPNDQEGEIVVKPLETPRQKWAKDIKRRSITFQPAKKPAFHGKHYCKLNISDRTGKRKKSKVGRGQRRDLPKWFGFLSWRMRLKGTVTTSKARDLNHQVILARPSDHALMIRCYFALRVWTAAARTVVD